MSEVHRPARLKDVATLAGVSVKTVSNVVHDYPYVRPSTRAKVRKAIEQLAYVPNVTARRLRSGSTGVIALAVPELTSPYFAELAHHVVQAALLRGWTVLVDETGQTGDRALRERERGAAAGIRHHLIDGVILSPLALTDEDLTRYGSVPMVLLGERAGSQVADHVAIDNRAAAAELTTHLLAGGRRRIAVIGSQSPPFGHTARQRLDGYRDALAAAGVAFDPALVCEAAQWDRDHGRAAVVELISRPDAPDAIFCFNDLLALGAVRGLYDAGVSVPGDVAVAGFDDSEDGRYAVPSLTTIAPDKRAIAAEAVERLARRLHGGEWTPQEVRVGYRLVVRESSRRDTPAARHERSGASPRQEAGGIVDGRPGLYNVAERSGSYED